MNRLLVSYDLHRPEQDYPGLIKAIKALGAAYHILYSGWAVLTPHTCRETRDLLKPHVDSNDKLLVVLIADWATLGIADANTQLGN